MNSELYLISVHNPKEKDSSLSMDMKDISVENIGERGNPIWISWKDYDGLDTEIYLLVKRKGNETDEFKFEM